MSIQTAAPLLAFIRKTETGFDDARAYDTMYGHKKIDPPLTHRTLDGAIAAGPDWTRGHKSSAAGAYQFMNQTLKDLRAQFGFSGSRRLDAQLQDEMGYALLKRRGFEKFMAGQISVNAFGKALAQEWASFPVLHDVQAAHRIAKRGQSFYVGDALNKALVKPEQVEGLLNSMRSGLLTVPVDLPDEHEPAPAPAASTGIPRPVLILIFAVAAIAVAIFIFNQLRG